MCLAWVRANTMSQPMEAAQIFGPTFSLLSTDIKLEVFDFIRSTVDQGNARLVSQVRTFLGD
jgi:hypothetical protein